MMGWKNKTSAKGPRLRVWAAVLEGFRFVAGNPLTMLRVLAIPVLCLAATDFALSWFMPPVQDEALGFREFAADSGEMILTILLVAMVLVAWQRRILLGPGAAGMRFGKRELSMAGAVTGIALVMALVYAAAVLVAIPVSLFGNEDLLTGIDGAAWIATAYLTGRLFFALPPIAMDSGTTLREAWRMSGTQAYKLMLIVALISIPFEAFSVFPNVLAETALDNGTPAAMAVAAFVQNFLFLLLIVVEAAALTFCYAALGGVQQIIEARNAKTRRTPAGPAAALA